MNQKPLVKKCLLLIGLCSLLATQAALSQIQGGNGAGVPPQGNQVIFYGDAKYTGMSRSFNTGNFGSGSLGFLGGNISSVYIPRGWYVIATARNGRTQTFTTSNAMLAAVGWDNQIVSGSIGMNKPGGGSGGQHGGNGGGLPGNRPVVGLYYDLNFTGRVVNFSTGSFPFLGINVAQNVTSLTVAPGYAVQVYDQLNLRGRSRIFYNSVNDLRQYAWDNRVASMTITRVNQGVRPPFGNR